MDQQEVNFLVPSRVASCRNLKNTVRKKTIGERKRQKSRHRALFIPKEGKETLEVNLEKGKDKTGSGNQILGAGVGYAKGRY